MLLLLLPVEPLDHERYTENKTFCALGVQVLLNKELIDINQDYPGQAHYAMDNFKEVHHLCMRIIIGKGGNRIGNWNCSDGSIYCQIWAKELHDGSYAIALYNAVSHQTV